MRKQAKEPIDDNACNTFGAYVGSGDDQLTCVDGCAIGAGRVVRAERRAEAAEAAAQEAAAVAAAAAREARAAIDETERLRAEGVDLSRWREAVVNLRDALETAQRGARGEGDDGSEQRKKNEDGGRFLWNTIFQRLKIFPALFEIGSTWLLWSQALAVVGYRNRDSSH